MRCKSLLLACSVVALSGGSAHAAEWRLVEVSGTVRIAVPGAEAAPARMNQAVPIGSSVTTTLGARAALDNGLQHIVVGPNSRMTVAPDVGGFTRVMQDLGAVMFKVDKQKAPHFRVDTPLLAAIVKGTTFTVVVGPQSDSVNVAEGLVEVRSNATDMASDVPAGSSGAVSRDAPQAVQVTGAVTPTSGEPMAVKIEPLDYKTVSNGLVESGGPAIMSTEAVPMASNNAMGDSAGNGSTGTEATAAAPAVLATEVARNDRATQADAGGPGSNGNGADAPAGGKGGGPKDPGQGGPGGKGDDDPGNGNGGGPKDPGPPGPNGNGNGNGTGPKDPGPAGPGGKGDDGPGNGNGGPQDPGPPGPNGNGNGNGGGPKDPGPAGPGGKGDDGPGNGNGGGPKDPGPAGPGGRGDGPGNENGGSPKDPGPPGPNGNGNGASTETGNAGNSGNGNGNNGNGNGNGNGGASTETGNAGNHGNGNGSNGNGSGLVDGLLTTVGGVTDGLIGPGKGRGPK